MTDAPEPECLHMTREMANNCPICNPLLGSPKPRSNAISPVVTMGAGGPDNTSEAMDLTAPEAVERLIVWLMDAHEIGDTSKNPEVWRALEALSAKLAAEREKRMGAERVCDILDNKRIAAEAELDAYREMQAESNAQGGPSVIRLQMQARRDRIDAEKAKAERDAALGWQTVAESNQQIAQSWQACAEIAGAERDKERARAEAAEAERDKYRRLWQQARGVTAGKRARQKGGEG